MPLNLGAMDHKELAWQWGDHPPVFATAARRNRDIWSCAEARARPKSLARHEELLLLRPVRLICLLAKTDACHMQLKTRSRQRQKCRF